MLVRARSVILALVCVFVAAAPVAVGPSGRAQRRCSARTIESIIHDYLMQHPDVLIAALRAAEDKMSRDTDAKATQSVAQNGAEILDDPATPVAGNPRARRRSSSSSITAAPIASRSSLRSRRC